MFRHLFGLGHKARSLRRGLGASSAAARSRSHLTLECLEDRMVLSTINWTNRGQAGDNFAAVFGANANLARSVVDTAIREWSTVIQNFHQVNHGDNKHIDVTISMNTNNNSGGASTSVTSTDANGKPLTATISIGTGPWFLNQNLFSSAF